MHSSDGSRFLNSLNCYLVSQDHWTSIPNYFFLQAPKLPCNSNHLGDDAQVRHSSPPLTARAGSYPASIGTPRPPRYSPKPGPCMQLPPTAGFVHGASLLWRCDASRVQRRPRRHRPFNYPPQIPTRSTIQLRIKEPGMNTSSFSNHPRFLCMIFEG